jgi:hypothetical protein
MPTHSAIIITFSLNKTLNTTNISLFKKYFFKPSNKLDIPMVCIEGATIIPKNGIYVTAVPRSS